MAKTSQLIAAVVLCASCAQDRVDDVNAEDDMNALVREYLFLELSMGWHDEGHVDAYFGEEEIRTAANHAQLGLDEITARATELRSQFQARAKNADSTRQQARLDGLVRRLTALETRITLASGGHFDFDVESERLFAATAPDNDAAYFSDILAQIDTLVGGEGNLSDRVNAFHMQFAIPEERLAAVFDAAIGECRRRTLEHIDLPANESFSVEYVTDKPWSGTTGTREKLKV